MAQPARLTKSEIERRRAAAERARGMLDCDSSRSFSDELIAERRAEARAEDCADQFRRRADAEDDCRATAPPSVTLRS